jgi:signal peptidase I
MNDAPVRFSKEWWRKEWREWQITLLLIVAILACRSVLVDWNYVPSGSMQPSILIGDRILVDRRAFDLRVPFSTISLARTGEPVRGDIVVFWSPANGERLIKRLIGLPGDTLDYHDQVLTVNGERVAYARSGVFEGAIKVPGMQKDAVVFEEALPGHPHPVALVFLKGNEFGPITLPPDHYWMMGDNRDNSGDSRVFGPVPRKALAGRASRVIWSIDDEWDFRWSRFGERLP